MHQLSARDITRIAADAAREQSPNLKVVGVTLGGGGSDYREVIIDIAGCHKEPCRLAVGILRSASHAAVRDQIAAHLRVHAREHRL